MTQTYDCFYNLFSQANPSQAELVGPRKGLLTELRALGVSQIEVWYEADEDTGSVESVNFMPASVAVPKDMRERVAAFGLDFTYSINLGFKDSLANRGALTWDLLQDNIDTDHIEYRSYTENVTHQGL